MYYLSKESTFLGITEESCGDCSKFKQQIVTYCSLYFNNHI